MKKLYRSKNLKVAGVCAGIAEYLKVDETIVRLIFMILLFTPFPIVISYILMWIVIPIQSEKNHE